MAALLAAAECSSCIRKQRAADLRRHCVVTRRVSSPDGARSTARSSVSLAHHHFQSAPSLGSRTFKVVWVFVSMHSIFALMGEHRGLLVFRMQRLTLTNWRFNNLYWCWLSLIEKQSTLTWWQRWKMPCQMRNLVSSSGLWHVFFSDRDVKLVMRWEMSRSEFADLLRCCVFKAQTTQLMWLASIITFKSDTSAAVWKTVSYILLNYEMSAMLAATLMKFHHEICYWVQLQLHCCYFLLVLRWFKGKFLKPSL